MNLFRFIIVSLFLGIVAFSLSDFDNLIANADIESPKILKQNIQSELATLIISDKKEQKLIDNAYELIGKSLDDNFWIDDYSLSMKGKKVFDYDQDIIKGLLKIKSVDVSELISALINSDRLLAQMAIDSFSSDLDDKKIQKLLFKSNEEMLKAQMQLEHGHPEKSIHNFKKAWDLTSFKHILDMTNFDTATFDAGNDGTIDYFLSLRISEKSKKSVQIDYKIQDECVDLGPKDPSDVGGDTFDDAAMKIGISDQSINRQWLIENVKASNNWFDSKHNDANKMIDLFYLPTPFGSFDDDVNGDDVIQGDDKKSSFTHFSSIRELNDQSGWVGTVYFDVPSGDYILWTIHPAGGRGGCDILGGLGVLVSIPE